MKINDLVVTKLLNRWNLPCCGNIISISDNVAKVLVFNVHGPGADAELDIPIMDLKIFQEE